jgi:hypothetical protein
MRRKSIMIRGQKLQLRTVKRLVDADGICDPPSKKNRAIRVVEGLTPERELDVWIHEMLHACFWDLDEDAVAESATDIAHALFLLGYRKD